jgi:hypothetical protein
VPYGYNQGYSIEKHTVDALIDHLSDTVELVELIK